jgi:two-component system chemotaxis response regulator CheB
MENTKKVLIVDDSAFMRRVISDIISSDPRCEVVGTAADGKEALEKVKSLKPDVISLDIQMPVMDGLSMLKQLNKVQPTPVVMMSTLTKEGAKETIEALELGAFDFVAKPDNIFKVNSDEIKTELLEKIYLAASAGEKSTKKFKPSISRTIHRTPAQIAKKPPSKKVSKLVAIGTSTGGPRALQYVLPYLPGDLDAGVVIVQHMPPGFTKSLSDRLNQLSEINVKEAEDGDVIENGHAYIAPGDKHLNVKEKADGTLYIALSNEGPVGGHIPAVNVMLSSIAQIKQKKLIGVIMTGMGADGTKGMNELHDKREVHVIAQDEPSCVVYGMPKALVESGIADEIVSLDQISNSITKKLEVL